MSLDWLKTTIDWPYELLYAEAHVLPDKNTNPLERILLEILQVFKEDLPTPEEAARQLGIMEPAFIAKTLQQMIEKGLLEKEANDPLDFAHCRITAGQSENSPNTGALEKHGVRFCVDAITLEHIPFLPFEPKEKPVQPLITPSQLPAQRQHLGLDKARQWTFDQDEPFLTESGHIADMVLLPERGRYVWQNMPVALTIEGPGHLSCQLESGTPLQQEWIDQQDLKPLFFSQLRIPALDQNPFPLHAEVSPFKTWKSHVKQLIAPGRLTRQMIEGIRSAQDTLCIHGFWLGIESVRTAVLQTPCHKRVVFGGPSVLNQIPGISQEQLAKVALQQGHPLLEKALLLADRQWGIALERLSLTTSAGKQTEIIVPSFLKADPVLSFMNELTLY